MVNLVSRTESIANASQEEGRLDPIALLVPVAGIGLILLVVWLTGGLRRSRIGDGEAARRQVALDWPEFRPAEVLLDRDERTALIASVDGAQLAALAVVGSEIACRLVSPADVTDCRTAS